MSEKLKALQEKRLALAAKIREIAAKLDGEPDSAELKPQWDAVNADFDACEAELAAENAREEESTKRTERLSSIEASLKKAPRFGRDGARVSDGPTHTEEFGGDSRESQFGLALQGWLRSAGPNRGEVTDQHRNAAKACGIDLAWNELSIKLPSNFGDVLSEYRHSQVRNALSGQDGSTGGYTFGETFVGRMELAMLAFGSMFQTSEVIRTSTGEPMRWPTADDTGNSGRQLGENAVVTATAQPSFAQVVWNAYKYTSDEILVPFELLTDNAVNLASVLPQMLGERLGRIQNTRYTTGTGAAQPKGIVTAATAGVTAASATAIAWDEIIDLEHSLDPSRRSMPGVGYMLHDSVLKALRKLKDGEGRYLFQVGANTGAPSTINTYPYTINQDMASSIASAAITILFGHLPSYKIRQVNDIRMYRLTERHRENDQDAFLAFIRGDGNLLDAGDGPVRKLTQA